MINKVFGDTVWVVAGKSDQWEKPINKAWLRSIHPPYYAGHGFALSLGKWSLRLGVCTPLYNDVNLEDEDSVIVYTTMGTAMDNQPKEIGEWGSSEPKSQQSDQESQESLERKKGLLASAHMS